MMPRKSTFRRLFKGFTTFGTTERTRTSLPYGKSQGEKSNSSPKPPGSSPIILSISEAYEIGRDIAEPRSEGALREGAGRAWPDRGLTAARGACHLTGPALAASILPRIYTTRRPWNVREVGFLFEPCPD